MSFEQLNHVFDFKERKSLKAVKILTDNDSFYTLPDGKRILNPAVLCEASGQVAGWLAMASNNFDVRPLLISEEKAVMDPVFDINEPIYFDTEVLDFSTNEYIVTSGRATAGNKVIFERFKTFHYLGPQTEFAEPSDVKKFYDLISSASIENILKTNNPKDIYSNKKSFEYLPGNINLISSNNLDHVSENKISGWFMAPKEAFYLKDHFPKKPVVPGVILLAHIGEFAQYFSFKDEYFQHALIPTRIQNLKIRKFVEPGQKVDVELEVVPFEKELSTEKIKKEIKKEDKKEIKVAAKFKVLGKPILKVSLDFRKIDFSIIP